MPVEIKLSLAKETQFKTPVWSKSTAKPGEAVEARITASDLAPGQKVSFAIYDASDRLQAVLPGDQSHKASWKPPVHSDGMKFYFFAQLGQVPGPKNGFSNFAQRLKSGELELKKLKLEVEKIDAAFVPKQEKLELKYKLDDAAGYALKGRYEIWGERYPTDKPIYSENFTPAAGQKTWNSWYGGKDPNGNSGAITENGPLKTLYLTPEFTPYRVRIIVGPDQDTIDEPWGAGLGKVAMVEAAFEVSFMGIFVRVQKEIEDSVKLALEDVLAVEPRTAKGVYREMGRLPLKTEAQLNNGWQPGQAQVAEGKGVGRIRLPCHRHTVIGESLSQDSSNGGGGWRCRIADGYMSNAGNTKFSIDSGVYTRAELPLEVEARLKSRDPEKNKKLASASSRHLPKSMWVSLSNRTGGRCPVPVMPTSLFGCWGSFDATLSFARRFPSAWGLKITLCSALAAGSMLVFQLSPGCRE